MYCRLEHLDDTEYNIRLHLKKSLKLWINTLKYSGYTFQINMIQRFADVLGINVYLLSFVTEHSGPEWFYDVVKWVMSLWINYKKTKNIVIGIQSSLSHIHWPLFEDQKEDSIGIGGINVHKK